MLVSQDHPIRLAILAAAEAVLGANYAINSFDVTSGGFTLSDETRIRLVNIERAYAPLAEAASASTAASSREGENPVRGVDIDETLCFVIMSFSGSPRLKDFYSKAVKPTVQKLGYRCERVDEQHFNGSIREQVLANIRCARFVIADMTEARPNCYYELGIAHALGKDVIHISNDSNDIHFDIKDFNFIVYQTIDELKSRLRDRIEHTLPIPARETAASTSKPGLTPRSPGP